MDVLKFPSPGNYEKSHVQACGKFQTRTDEGIQSAHGPVAIPGVADRPLTGADDDGTLLAGNAL